jgi:glutaredoxin
MQVEILVTNHCPACDHSVAIWRTACGETDATLEVTQVNNPEGRARLAAMKLGTVPAVVIDGKLVAVGLQSEQLAHELLAAAGNR